jgi:hypothetical protein
VAYIPRILIRKNQTLAAAMRHCPAAARANPSLGEARGGHEEGVELLLEAGRVPEPPLTIVYAWRRGAAAASHLAVVPCRISSWVRTLLTPTLFCPPKPRAAVPKRAHEQSSDKPLMAPPWRTYAPHLSAGFDVSRPLIDGGPGLDCRYLFILIKFELQIKESTAESDLLCHGLISQNHGPGPWDRGPIPRNFQ